MLSNGIVRLAIAEAVRSGSNPYFFFFSCREARFLPLALWAIARVASKVGLRCHSVPTREHISRPASPTISPDTQNGSIGFNVNVGHGPLLSELSGISPSVPT